MVSMWVTRVPSLRSSELFVALCVPARETCVRQNWGSSFLCCVFWLVNYKLHKFISFLSVLYCFRMLCNWRGAPMLLSLFVRLFSCSNSPTYLSRSWLTPWWKSLMWTLLPVLFSCPCKSVDVVAHLVTRMCKVTHLFCWQWTWTWTCIVARQKQGSCL